jgi:hypothetical protein
MMVASPSPEDQRCMLTAHDDDELENARFGLGKHVPCPRCFAAEGSPCVSPSGESLTTHQARILMANDLAMRLANTAPPPVAVRGGGSKWLLLLVRYSKRLPSWAADGIDTLCWRCFPKIMENQRLHSPRMERCSCGAKITRIPHSDPGVEYWGSEGTGASFENGHWHAPRRVT